MSGIVAYDRICIALNGIRTICSDNAVTPRQLRISGQVPQLVHPSVDALLSSWNLRCSSQVEGHIIRLVTAQLTRIRQHLQEAFSKAAASMVSLESAGVLDGDVEAKLSRLFEVRYENYISLVRDRVINASTASMTKDVQRSGGFSKVGDVG